MAGNLGDFLGNLGLSIGDCGQSSGEFGFSICFLWCRWTGCHGLASNIDYCPSGDCSQTACNSATSNLAPTCNLGVCSIVSDNIGGTA